MMVAIASIALNIALENVVRFFFGNDHQSFNLPIMRDITMFSGNTILGDGAVIMILDPNAIARATGISGGAEAGRANRPGTRDDPPPAEGNPPIAMLLFRAGGPQPRAVPLGLVTRLEEFTIEQIEFGSGHPVTQYRGRLMPLVPMSGALDLAKPNEAVIVPTRSPLCPITHCLPSSCFLICSATRAASASRVRGNSTANSSPP